MTSAATVPEWHDDELAENFSAPEQLAEELFPVPEPSFSEDPCIGELPSVSASPSATGTPGESSDQVSR